MVAVESAPIGEWALVAQSVGYTVGFNQADDRIDVEIDQTPIAADFNTIDYL